VTTGFATPEGTHRLAARFAAEQSAGFYRTASGLAVSSLGLGTYLGQPDDATDERYREAVQTAIRRGINVIDTAINYRSQRSERAIGAALEALFASGEARRDELVICTKAGFLTPGAIPGFLTPGHTVGRMHSMDPDFIADQIDRSRANLGLDTLDVFYLHNPETQLNYVSREDFANRVAAAFERLEFLAAQGRIRFYGTATWEGYRTSGLLNLTGLAGMARRAGGDDHHFRFIQLPYNLGMVEAYAAEPESVLEQAARAGITVVASATLHQSRLAADLPEAVQEMIPGLATDAQRAIQFTRSAPGIAVALVGMSRAAHAEENAGVARVPPLGRDAYRRLFA
jgi:aryl-alcohol dehydrogenase-like predicted oxidoreductase